MVNHEVNKAGLVDITGAAGETNVQGEDQQKLDVYANEKVDPNPNQPGDCLRDCFRRKGRLHHHFRKTDDHQNKYVVLMDPLDGSSNIDVNVSVGTIFSIYRRVSPVGTPVQLEDFLQPGNKQVAAGYVVYGTSTMLVYTTGHGVNGFTLNPALGSWYLSHPYMKFPKKEIFIL